MHFEDQGWKEEDVIKILYEGFYVRKWNSNEKKYYAERLSGKNCSFKVMQKELDLGYIDFQDTLCLVIDYPYTVLTAKEFYKRCYFSEQEALEGFQGEVKLQSEEEIKEYITKKIKKFNKIMKESYLYYEDKSGYKKINSDTLLMNKISKRQGYKNQLYVILDSKFKSVDELYGTFLSLDLYIEEILKGINPGMNDEYLEKIAYSSFNKNLTDLVPIKFSFYNSLENDALKRLLSQSEIYFKK